MIKTDICDLLQIEYPIFQGGMAWLGTAELAAAVSEAGGLGIIGAGHMPPDIFRNEIHKLKERTSKPFGCNIMLMSPFVKEGDSVTEGQTLCIVEAMKLMNEVKSTVSGKVKKILVKDKDGIKKGQTLMIIE